MVESSLSESALRSALTRHLGFLSAHGYGEPVIEKDQRRGRARWLVYYGSTSGVGIEFVVDPDEGILWTHLVAPKGKQRWSLDAMTDVRSDPWDRSELEDSLAAEARALESVQDALRGDFSMYTDRAL